VTPDGPRYATPAAFRSALNYQEMTERLGFEKHAPPGAGSGNIRNGTRGKTVRTEARGHVEIDVSRDRAGTFEPQIVKKQQRRLNDVDEIVLSLHAKGLTTGEISAHFTEIYRASVSKLHRTVDRLLVRSRVHGTASCSRVVHYPPESCHAAALGTVGIT